MKTMYLISGGIGSGKSFLASILLRQKMFVNIEYISADVYKKTFFNEYKELHEGYRLAKLYMKYKIEKILKLEKSFVFEMVPSKDEKFELLKKIKHEYNYQIICFFIGTSSNKINVERVKKRHVQGADFVSEEKVKTRYLKSLYNLGELIDLSDKIFFLDNSTSKLKLIGFKTRKTLHIYNSIHWFKKYILSLISKTLK